MLVYPKRQPSEAWQYKPPQYMPLWVFNCTMWGEGGLLHKRRSGNQLLNIDEWLVRDLDGEINFYTDAEMWRIFER